MDERPDTGLKMYHDVLASRDRVLPVFGVDARNRDHIMLMIEALVATA